MKARFVCIQGVQYAYRTGPGESFMARGIAEAIAVMRKRGATRLEAFYGPMDWREIYREAA